MADLAVRKLSKEGTSPVFTPAGVAGDTFPNNGKTFLIVKNANVTSDGTATINSLTKCNQGFDHDVIVSVPASGEKWIGPFEPSRFNNSAGKVSATYESETDLTVAAVSL